MVTAPAVRCPSLRLTAVPPQQHNGAASAAASCPARRQPGCGSSSRRQRSQAPAFADHQQLPAADDPASSRRNGDPGATSSGESAGNGAEVQAPPSSDAAITALRAELDALRLTVSTQAAAAQQQFTSISSLERDLRGGARGMSGEPDLRMHPARTRTCMALLGHNVLKHGRGDAHEDGPSTPCGF